MDRNRPGDVRCGLAKGTAPATKDLDVPCAGIRICDDPSHPHLGVFPRSDANRTYAAAFWKGSANERTRPKPYDLLDRKRQCALRTRTAEEVLLG